MLAVDPDQATELKQILQSLDPKKEGQISFDDLKLSISDREGTEELLEVIK